jgi:hypothetical protein
MSRSGCSGGSLPGNNHDAGIRDDPETPRASRRSEAGRLFHRLTHSHGREISPGFRMKNGPVSPSARQPVDQFGLNYDDVGSHGWYKNLEPTISQLLATLHVHGRGIHIV